jgi:pimeloyl-ACP methyl ester carboxylesterase
VVEANKPPLLFIHGAFTRAARWRSWIDWFRDAGFTCVAPSLPAHDPPDMAALARLTFDDYVEAMVAAHAALPVPPVIVGSSMGGLIAQHVAARTNSAGLVLISSAPPWRGGGKMAAVPYALSYFLPVLLGRALRGNKDAALKLVLHDLSEEEKAEFMAIFADESGAAYRSMVYGLAPIAGGAVKCPVLCLSASGDRLFRPVVAERLAAFYKAKHLIYPGGHTLASAAIRDEIGADIVDWIDKLDRAAAPSFRTGAIV